MAIERTTLRAQVRNELMSRMRAGKVEPGQGINEVQLAAELGVSRTPLREALIGLESEGQITSENGKGFRFVKLSADEFEELAPVLAVLEGLAVELTPVAKIRRLGARLGAIADTFDVNVAEHALISHRDDEWHELMLSECPNSRLMILISSVRQLFHRYESLLVPDEVMIERNAAEHRDIAHALADGNVAKAQRALRANWVNAARRIRASASIAYLDR